MNLVYENLRKSWYLENKTSVSRQVSIKTNKTSRHHTAQLPKLQKLLFHPILIRLFVLNERQNGFWLAHSTKAVHIIVNAI